jgi:hypothetical protein
MSFIPAVIDREVASVNGSQANGIPVYVGGREFSMQLFGPAALGRLEVSQDRFHWDENATLLDDGVLTHVGDRPLWARLAVDSDASGPRTFRGRFMILKESN